MPSPQYGDYQHDICFDGRESRPPKYPVEFASLDTETQTKQR
jgi:hypothetical protein